MPAPDFALTAPAKLAALLALRDSPAYEEVFLSKDGVHQEDMREAEAFFLHWAPTADADRLQTLSAHVLAWAAAKKGLTWIDDQIQDLERQMQSFEQNRKESAAPDQQ